MLGPPQPGHTLHNLFVQTSTRIGPQELESPAVLKGRRLTLQVLQYIQDHLGALAKMGIKVRVNRLRRCDLANSRVTQAMKNKGITRLPALVTPNRVYVGMREIAAVYERNIKAFEETVRRSDPVSAGDRELRHYYADEMSFERATQDQADGDVMDESADMMDDYRKLLQRREQRESSAPAPTVPPAGARPDNVAAPGPGPGVSLNPDNDPDTAMLIGRLEADLRPYEPPFSGGAQDDLMETAYWANQKASM